MRTRLFAVPCIGTGTYILLILCTVLLSASSYSQDVKLDTNWAIYHAPQETPERKVTKSDKKLLRKKAKEFQRIDEKKQDSLYKFYGKSQRNAQLLKLGEFKGSDILVYTKGYAALPEYVKQVILIVQPQHNKEGFTEDEFDVGFWQGGEIILLELEDYLVKLVWDSGVTIWAQTIDVRTMKK